MRLALLGTALTLGAPSWQWQPGLTAHNPRPPLPLLGLYPDESTPPEAEAVLEAKGTDVTAAAFAVISAASTLEVGSKAGAENLDGNLWAMEVVQLALSDTAVVRY